MLTETISMLSKMRTNAVARVTRILNSKAMTTATSAPEKYPAAMQGNHVEVINGE